MRYRKLISMLLAVCMLLGVMPGNVSAAQSVKSDDIVILYTNDIHTYIDGNLSYDVIAAIKAKLQEKYNNVILVDAGDHIQGTAYGSMDNGETIIKLMNAAGYDVATLGNHEFDYGMYGCMKAIELAAYPYVSCNFYHEENGVRKDNVLPGYVIKECGNEKVAFVGITTPETFTKTTPAYFQDEQGNYIYGISAGDDGSDMYADVQKAIDEAKQVGATRVIALGHLGDEEGSRPWTSMDTIANVTGLDAFIDGHSHSVTKADIVADKSGKNVVLTQTGEYFDRIGIMKLDVETGAVTTDFIEVGDDGKLSSALYADTEYVSDAAVKNIKDQWLAHVDGQLNQVIGSAEVTLDNYDADNTRLVRIQETNAGDFCADALYYLFDNMGMDVDVAIMNGGGIRNQAVTGTLTYKTCKEIHTFGNVACLQTVTGRQLLDALEWGARTAGIGECGGFLQVSGITYKIDTTIPDTTQKDDKGVWIGGPTGEYRVKDVKVYNKTTNEWDDLKTDAKYNLAGYNYTLRDLGDGFAMFEGAVNVLDYVMEDYMVLANYVRAFENGTVGAANSPLMHKYPALNVNYGTVNGSGRIDVSDSSEDSIIIGGLDSNVWFTKYGNVYTNCKVADFLQKYAIGDIVNVKFLNQELELPVVPTYAYVDSGEAAIIAKFNSDNEPEGYISFAINMGNFAQEYGLAIKQTGEGGDWWWEACEGVTYPVEVTFEMADKGGYNDEIQFKVLSGSNNREDYEALTDEEFANFRIIDTTGMGRGRVYRTSSPINPAIGRNTYAFAALEKAGVTVIMNLADNAEEAAMYQDFADSYYAKQKVIYLNVGVDFEGDEFKEGLAKGLRYFAENEGVYAIHCNYGKDRAGFVSAVIQCLMGATYEEVVEDYMTSYYNYYGVEPGSEQYQELAGSNIVKSLSQAFGVADLTTANLEAEAEEYVSSLGLTDDEINSLKTNLGADNTPSTGDNSNVAGYVMLMLMALAVFTACAVADRRKRMN